jgi:phage terminase large subunit-like protein
MMMDGEQGAQVYAAATKEDQARIVVNDAGQIIRKTLALKDRFKLYKSREKITRVVYPYTNSFMHPLGSDSDSQDGFDPSYGIIDEYHAHPNDMMLNVLESGMGARRQPLMDIITTAGFNKDYPCYLNLRKTASDILEGKKHDDSFFALIYELDPDDDWQDETNWIKANPNLGVSVNLEFLRSRALMAKNEGSTKEIDFKTKNLNIWTDSPDTWISDEIYMKCDKGIYEPQPNDVCYGGLDLASVRDFVALCFVFPKEGINHLVSYFFVNEEMVRLRKMDGFRYDIWQQKGLIEVTPGNATDYNYIKKRIQEICTKFDVKAIHYDRYNSSQLVIDLLEEEIPMVEFGQGFVSMSSPTKEFEKQILCEEINHQGNEVLRWMMGNVTLRTDPAGNIKVDKGKSQDKVDGVVAAVMALGAKMNDKNEEFCYDNRDIIVL